MRAASARGRASGLVGTTVPMSRATAPPTSASSHRDTPSPVVATNATMKTDCTPAWMTTSWPEEMTIAIAMAATTTRAIWTPPLPSRMTITSPTSTPMATPTVTSTMRRSRWP